MKITVKFLSTYRRYLPEETGTALEWELPTGATVRDLLAELPLPSKDKKIVLVNGRGVGPDAILHEGDAVAIFPAVAGG